MKKMRMSWFGDVWTLLVVVFVAVVLFAPRTVLATAATAEVDTPARSGDLIVLVQGSNVVYAGTLVCVDSSGLVEHATDAASKKVIGRAEVTQDNTGSSYSATKTIKVRRGIFRWTNGDSFTDANIGDLAYVEDNQTVQTGASASSDIIAGVIIDVDSDGVWVDTHDIGSQGAGSVTTIAASGAATLGSTLSVAGASTLTGAATLQSTANIAGAATLSNNLSVAGASTLTGAASIGGNATLSKAQINAPATQTLGAGAFTLTVTNAVIILQPSGVATVALANASTAGLVCTLINNAATNIVFEDSGNLALTGTVTMAQWDSLTVRAPTTSQWVSTSQTDN